MDAEFKHHVRRFKHNQAAAAVSAADSPAPNAQALAGFIAKVAATCDKQAYAVLFKYYAPRVKTYLRRCGLGVCAADEVTQEVMLLLWRKASSFDPLRANASTWVFAIARNARIDHLRRIHALPPAPDEDVALSLSAETLMMDAENADRVRTALASLSTEQQQIMQLFFLAETPHSAIATALNLPLGTVKSRIRLAITRLRQLLLEDAP